MAAIRLLAGQSQSATFPDTGLGAFQAGAAIAYFVEGAFGSDAVTQTGVVPGQPHPENPALFARSYRVSAASEGAGSIVEWQYSSQTVDGSAYQPFDPIADLQAYSYSVSFQEVENDIPLVRTIKIQGDPDANGDPVQATGWSEPELRRVRTVLTKITLRTGATSQLLGLAGTDKATDLDEIRVKIAQFTNKIVTVSGQQYLFRIEALNQSSTPIGGNFATARWEVEYSLTLDPGDVADPGSLAISAGKRAFIAWTSGDGTGPDDEGYMIPRVPSPYTNGPTGFFQRPPFSEVFAAPAAGGTTDAVLNKAPQFQSRALYDTSSMNFFALPGVP